MPTIRDVAREAGVSVTTVSHVFSEKRQVAKATRDRVLEVASALGYSPDGAARALATGRSTTIGLHFQLRGEALLLNPFFSAFLSGLAATSAELGFAFMLLPDDPEEHPERSWGSLGGVIVVDPTPENPWVPKLVRDGTRVVTISRYLGGARTSWVDNDHQQAMRDIVRHLSEQGYQHVAFVSVKDRFSAMADMERAFGEAVVSAGVAGDLVYARDLSERATYELSLDLLNRGESPDAVVAAVDFQAVGVLQASKELGIKVPDHLGVVGGGDTVLAQHSKPPLTSVRGSPELLAREALKLLATFWNDPEAPDREILLPAELVVRESSMRL